MKAGDKVGVIELETEDIGKIQIGDVGQIVGEHPSNDGDSIDVFYINFERALLIDETDHNLNKDGTYSMCRSQLEVIE